MKYKIFAIAEHSVDLNDLAHEIADAIVNPHGYASDATEATRRAVERDRIEDITLATLKTELRLS